MTETVTMHFYFKNGENVFYDDVIDKGVDDIGMFYIILFRDEKGRMKEIIQHPCALIEKIETYYYYND